MWFHSRGSISGRAPAFVTADGALHAAAHSGNTAQRSRGCSSPIPRRAPARIAPSPSRGISECSHADGFPPVARPALAVELQRVGGLTICVPARPEDLASLAESGSCSSPVWGRVWPAGEALALSLMEFPLQYMCSNASNLADVGAGIGVAGLAAAAAGAREVTLLEAEPLALDLASESAACMGCQAITRDGDPDWFFGADLCRGVTYSLHAADDEDGNQELPLAGTRLHLSCCDWNAAGADPRRAGKYDVVLASDVLYGGANEAASLAPSLAALLQEGGTLAVADPAKRTPSATRQAFIEAAAAAGMELTGASDITVDSESLLPEDEMDYSVLLMLFEKAGDAGK